MAVKAGLPSLLIAASAAVVLVLGLLHLSLGLATLLGYVFLARRYWFSLPFRGILLATVLYTLALVVRQV